MAKKGSSVMSFCTYAGSITLESPLSPRRHASAKRAPAYAIDNVADPCATVQDVDAVPHRRYDRPGVSKHAQKSTVQVQNEVLKSEVWDGPQQRPLKTLESPAERSRDPHHCR